MREEAAADEAYCSATVGQSCAAVGHNRAAVDDNSAVVGHVQVRQAVFAVPYSYGRYAYGLYDFGLYSYGPI